MSEQIKPVALKVGNKLFSGNDVASAVTFSLKHVEIIEQLYTKQQIQPRVKMTREQADDFKDLHAQYNLLSDVLNNIYEAEHLPMKFWITTGKLRQNELMIATLWANYNPEHPEETIELIHEKKWFVRNRCEEIYLLVEGAYFKNVGEKEIATRFDTKEQADEWTNPLTEAVLLPVGDE